MNRATLFLLIASILFFNALAFCDSRKEEGAGNDGPVQDSCKSPSCINLNSMYSKDSERVYIDSVDYKGVIAGADPKTFVLLSRKGKSPYAKDKNTVFFFEEPVTQADPKTFRQLNERYGKDANHVFHMATILTGADAKTFSTPYPHHVWHAKDEHRVFYAGEVVAKADPATFKVLKDDKSCGPNCTYRAEDKNHKYGINAEVVGE